MNVPLGRYVLFVGSVLLALLLFAGSYLPQPTESSDGREARVDKSVIRISSAHRWPEKVVYDTTQPTFVPPAVVAAAEAPTPGLPANAREAFAKIAVVTPSTKSLPVAVQPKRKLKRRPPEARIVAYREPSYGWSPGW